MSQNNQVSVSNANKSFCLACHVYLFSTFVVHQMPKRGEGVGLCFSFLVLVKNYNEKLHPSCVCFRADAGTRILSCALFYHTGDELLLGLAHFAILLAREAGRPHRDIIG